MVEEHGGEGSQGSGDSASFLVTWWQAESVGTMRAVQSQA